MIGGLDSKARSERGGRERLALATKRTYVVPVSLSDVDRDIVTGT